LFAEGIIYGISPKGWDRYSKENHPAFLGPGQVLQSAGVQDTGGLCSSHDHFIADDFLEVNNPSIHMAYMVCLGFAPCLWARLGMCDNTAMFLSAQPSRV